MFNGSTLGHINQNRLNDFQIPIPNDIKKLKPILTKISNSHSKISDITVQIPQKEKEICELIKTLTEEGKEGVDWDEYKFDDLIEYQKKTIKYKASDGKIKGKYKFYTSSQYKILFIDNEPMFKEQMLIMGRNVDFSIHYDKNFSCEHDHVYVIKVKNYLTRYLYYYFKNNSKWFIDQMNGSIIKGTSKEILSKFIIKVIKDKILTQYKLQEKFDEVDKLKEELETTKKTYQEDIDKLMEPFKTNDKIDDESDDNLTNNEKQKDLESVKSKQSIKSSKSSKSSKSTKSNSNKNNLEIPEELIEPIIKSIKSSKSNKSDKNNINNNNNNNNNNHS